MTTLNIKKWVALLAVLPLVPFASALAGDTWEATRLNDKKPIITESMFKERGATDKEGHNINGPAVIALPDWLAPEDRADPKAKYYMYFANHGGNYIRLAWAADPVGPWTLYNTGKNIPVGQRGVLDLGPDDRIESGGYSMQNHIASPEVLIDNENKRFVIYFHGMGGNKGWHIQYTMVAVSEKGLHFEDGLQPAVLGRGYFRVFTAHDHAWALSNGARLWKAPKGVIDGTEDAAFQSPPELRGKHVFLWKECKGFKEKMEGEWAEKLKMKNGIVRHTTLLPAGENKFHVFYTSKYSAPPERVMVTTLDASDPDWRNWTLSEAEEVLRTELEWEGVNYSIEPSDKGGKGGGAHQLRDPYVFRDHDGQLYLYYTGNGEDAIGVAKLKKADQND